MENIIDLTDGGGAHDAVHSTGSGGLIGGQLLNDRPLAAYLHDDEDVRYVLRNKKSGLDIVSEAGNVESLEPGSNYQTLAAATDRRLLVVVGKSAGNETKSLSFTDVVEARAKSGGLRKMALEIETLSDETWTFPCKDDPEVVATYIEDVAQTWANADRLLDDVKEQIATATARLDEGDQQGAAEALSDADETIETARQRSQRVGPGPRSEVAARADEITSRLSEAMRRVAATHGASAHANAQDAWSDEEYEEAAHAYETAVDAYEAALDREGSTPDDVALARRLRGAAGERELLRAGPLIDADTARRKAGSLDDPEAAAREWETALESYRDMLGLDWGAEERTFVTDRAEIREQAMSIAGDAIADHREAGRKWLSAGDELSLDDREAKAEQVYERAKDEFEQAHRLAKEVRPERADALAEDIDITEKRLDGEGIPVEKPDETVLPSDDEASDDQQEATDGKRDEETDDQQETADETHREDEQPGTTTTAVPQDSEGSLIDKLQSNKQPQSAAADTTDDSTAADGADNEAGAGTETSTSAPETGPTERNSGSDTAGGVAVTAPHGSGEESTEAEGETPTVATGGDEGSVTSRSNGVEEETESGEAAGEAGNDERRRTERRGEGDDEVTAATESDAVPAETASSGPPEPDSATGATGADGGSGTTPASKRAEPDEQPSRSEPDTLTPAEIQRRLTTLADDVFTDVVADIWEAQGWSTTVFSATSKAVYDILAMREQPEEHRLLLWTVHRPDGGALGATVVKRCATARDGSQGADSAMLVTTGSLTDAAEQSTDELGVPVVDSEKLTELIRFEGLEGRLVEATESGDSQQP